MVLSVQILSQEAQGCAAEDGATYGQQEAVHKALDRSGLRQHVVAEVVGVQPKRRWLMGFLDKAKEQATKIADKAQEAGKAGQDKLKDVQAKRQADSLLRDLGASVWAGRTDDEAKVRERLTAHEVEHGTIDTELEDGAAD